jgi:antibiotic biosynthesis monooxygenase (ABM) superfamily enzyme
VVTVINRRIKPGKEEDYGDWVKRLLSALRTFPGNRGITFITPDESDPNTQYVIYRFVDRASSDEWEKSGERRKLVEEVQNYATQQYNTASGMETWFKLPNIRNVSAPPKWKMALVALSGVFMISLITRYILGTFLVSLPLPVSVLIVSAIVVVGLTWVVMPNATRLLKRWLYPALVE